MSDPGGALASGPESPFVVGALDAVLDGDGGGGRRRLEAAAAATSWAAVLHRLDVAGRALALDSGLRPDEAPIAAGQVAELAAAADVHPVPAGIAEVLAAWSRGDGIPATVDLTSGAVDTAPEDARAWAAGLALAWLVERSGFPPQVVA